MPIAGQEPIVPTLANVQVLAQGVGGTHTGDLLEAVLATIAIPAGAMGANGEIVVNAQFLKTGAVGTFTPGLRLGPSGAGLSGAGMWQTLAQGAPILGWSTSPRISNAGAANSQVGSASVSGVGQSTGGVAFPVAAIDTTAACEICITGTLGNSGDTIALAFYQALLYPHA